jgi:hypothetical protein
LQSGPVQVCLRVGGHVLRAVLGAREGVTHYTGRVTAPAVAMCSFRDRPPKAHLDSCGPARSPYTHGLTRSLAERNLLAWGSSRQCRLTDAPDAEDERRAKEGYRSPPFSLLRRFPAATKST